MGSPCPNPASLPRFLVYIIQLGVVCRARPKRERCRRPQPRCRSFPSLSSVAPQDPLRLLWRIVLRRRRPKRLAKSTMWRCCGFRQSHSSPLRLPVPSPAAAFCRSLVTASETRANRGSRLSLPSSDPATARCLCDRLGARDIFWTLSRTVF